MNYQIYTLYVNRKDLLRDAINSLDEYMDRVVVLDNSPQQNLTLPSFPGEIYRPDAPLFCSQSYNLILTLAQRRQQEVFFVMHSDAEASNEVVAQMLERAEALRRDGTPWGVLFTNYDVLCLFHTAAVKEVRWDPYLPLYYTDVDYYRRLKLAGLQLVETGLPVGHREGGSTCMKADRALEAFIRTNYPAWREYYLRKWGGDRDQEQFTVPFDGAVA